MEINIQGKGGWAIPQPPALRRHKKLLAVLHKLVNAGNTLIVVEHNLDVIKTADWVIDLGPEGGEAGGRIVAEGRPEQVVKVRASHTGRFLAGVLTSTRPGKSS